MLDTKERLPWAGHSARHALNEVYELIKANKTTLVFVNTRSQAEMLFQELWRMNDDGLAIALHHGSLDVAQRRKVEDAMAAGKLRGVVCTSSLDLGVDWGDVDLVINIGAPKGASRLMQRIGRANHRIDEASRAVLVPANRFEVLECAVAIDAVAENAQDTPPLRTGALDVLAQHVLGCACGEPFLSDELYAEVLTAAPYSGLTRTDFDDVVDFVATGGYALKTYERFARIKQDKTGRWRVTNPRVRQSYRLNVGTIVEDTMLKVRLVRSRGATEDRIDRRARARRPHARRDRGSISSRGWWSATPSCSAARWCATRRSPKTRSMSRAPTTRTPKCRPIWAASFRSRPISPNASASCSTTSAPGTRCRIRCATGCRCRREVSRVPGVRELLVETFPRADKHYLVCYPFEGRLAHQTLGMLLTRRMERARVRPLGFVANEYALAVWGLGDMSFMIRQGKLDLNALFDPDMLGDDLEAWLAESALMKRTFRTCAVISGLIARRFTGEEKTRRQVLFSTDLIYDVLRKHQADHVLLRAARADAATGLLDIRRLSDMLRADQGQITHRELDRVSPLAVPVMLEIGREAVYGEASDELLAEAAEELVKEAKGYRINVTARAQSRWTTTPAARSRYRGYRRRNTARRSLRRAVLGRAEPARRLRPAPGKRLQLCHAAACCCRLTTRWRRSAGSPRVIARHDPRMVIALGDSFHDRNAHDRLSATDRDAHAPLAGAARLDLDIRQSRSGAAVRSRRRGRRAKSRSGRSRSVTSRSGASGEIAGHLHPKARVSTRGRSMERRCFACDGERAVMPAFGAYTGGLNIRDAAFAKIFQSPGFMAHVLGDHRLHTIAASRCY